MKFFVTQIEGIVQLFKQLQLFIPKIGWWSLKEKLAKTRKKGIPLERFRIMLWLFVSILTVRKPQSASRARTWPFYFSYFCWVYLDKNIYSYTYSEQLIRVVSGSIRRIIINNCARKNCYNVTGLVLVLLILLSKVILKAKYLAIVQTCYSVGNIKSFLYAHKT